MAEAGAPNTGRCLECGAAFQRGAGSGNALFMCDDCRDEAGEDHILLDDDSTADPVLLTNLKDMGFGEREARLALERTGNQNLEVGTRRVCLA
jgi:hypothetical protein